MKISYQTVLSERDKLAALDTLGSILPISSPLKMITLIPIVPEKMKRQKKFWSFVKSLKKDAYGINTLRENGILKTDTLDKANICNRQFQSAFTREPLQRHKSFHRYG